VIVQIKGTSDNWSISQWCSPIFME